MAIALVTISIQLLSAQDLIVTTDLDSVNCKIGNIYSKTISYSFQTESGGELKTIIPRNKVKEYQRNYYTKLEGPKTGQEHRQFVAALNGGYSYRTAEVPDNITSTLEEYLNDLKSGYNLGADLIYYFSNSSGAGLKYNRFRSSGSMDNVQIPDGMGGSLTGKMADDITITFVGLLYSGRLLSANTRHDLFFNFGLGYMGYHDEATYVFKYDLDGSTLGLTYDIGYNVGLKENLTLGAQLSYYMGTLKKVYYSDGLQDETIDLDEDTYEGLGRFDASLRLSYRF